MGTQSDESPMTRQDAISIIEMMKDMQDRLGALEGSRSPVTTPAVGESQGTSTEMACPSFSSATIPISSKVDDKIKQKIWAGEFVAMADLLEKNNSREFAMEIDQSTSSDSPALRFVQQNKITKLSFFQWCRAFNRFSYIAGIKEPENMLGFHQHMETVSQLFQDKAQWWAYDEDFRKLIGKETKWGSINFELYMEAKLSINRINPTSKPIRSGKGGGSIPVGACIQFHTRGSCKLGGSCSYQHKCYGCLSNHPFFNCQSPAPKPLIMPQFRKSQSNPPQTNQSFRPRPTPSSTAASANAGKTGQAASVVRRV